MDRGDPATSSPALQASDVDTALLSELVEYLRDNRSELREEWARRITDAHLLGAMTADEIFSEVTAVYDNYVSALETGSVETLQAYARDLSERIIPRGVETHEVLGIVLLLRDVLARSLFQNYQHDWPLLNRILDAYEPAANRIAVTVGVSFVEERERVIREQEEAIRELSTPVLQVRHRFLDPANHRHARFPARAPADGAATRRDPDKSRQGRRHRHYRRCHNRPQRSQPPRPDGRGGPSHGSQRDHHRLSRRSPRRSSTSGSTSSMMRTVSSRAGVEEAERLLGYRATGLDHPSGEAYP